MALDRQSEVGAGHAAAIVGDGDFPPAAAVSEDIDPAGAGIDGILDQFLDDARRTLHHLARGDAVDDLFGQLSDGHFKATRWISLNLRAFARPWEGAIRQVPRLL